MTTKPCIECHSQIPDAAVKCVHCEAYQTWRRHIRLSNTFLSLVIALVSVLGLVVPTLVDVLGTHESEITWQVVSVDTVKGGFEGTDTNPRGDTILAGTSYCLAFSILVQNAGSAPGVVSMVQLWLHDDGSGIAASADYRIPAEQAVIKPEDYRVIEAKVELKPVDQAMFPPRPQVPSIDQASISLQYHHGKAMLHFVEHDGTEDSTPFSLPGRSQTIDFEHGDCKA